MAGLKLGAPVGGNDASDNAHHDAGAFVLDAGASYPRVSVGDTPMNPLGRRTARPAPHRSRRWPLPIALAAGLLASPFAGIPIASAAQPEAEAPDPTDPDVYEGRRINDVILRPLARGDEEPAPLTDRERQNALNNIRTYAGGAYRKETIDADVRRLNRLGAYGEVRTLVQLLSDGSVNVIFELVARPLIRDIQVTGNRVQTDSDLAGVVDLRVGAPVDRFQIDRAARRIEDLYRERGYPNVQVTIDERELDESAIVLFRIREGQRLKVTDVRFTGSTAFTRTQLRRELETKTASLFHKGQLDEDKLATDVANLVTFYKNNGYLDVRADYIVQPSPNGREAIVEYIIDEGPLYTLREVQLEVEAAPGSAVPVFAAEQVAGLMPLKPGDVYGERDIEASVEAVRNAYGQLGYADAAVTRVERRDPELPVVDIVIVVREGGRFETGEVVIQGNTLTKHNVIRRQVELRPDRPLDSVAAERSERRVRNTRLFGQTQSGVKLTLQDPDPVEPLYRDVLIEVEEGNTGSIDIGGAVSSDAGLLGRIALTQRNFDLFDTPDSAGEFFSGRAFRGAGQTFQIELLPGDRVQNYSVSFSEPYLFDSPYSFSASAFFRDRDFDNFDEERYGTRFGFGRRFGTRWTGALNFRVESVALDDIPPDRPVDIFEVADRNLLTGVGFSLTRSSLDSRFRPTRGSRTRLEVEQVGVFGGDFDFTKLEAEYRMFIPLREDYLGRHTVLSWGTEIGYIPQGQSETPTYERFYLGGQSFRGLDFRTVSPRSVANDTGLPSPDPVGGTWLFYTGVEIQQPIFEDLLSVVAFVDSGTVLEEPGFEDYRVTVGIGFRIYAPQLSPAPLAFDFGFPIMKEDDDEDRLFTFTIDLPF